LPFDFECSTGVDLGEGANGSVICFDVAIASNANPPAAGSQSDARSDRENHDLFHMSGFCYYDGTSCHFGFNKRRELKRFVESQLPSEGIARS
jgi:hypothetical protein